MYTEEIKKLCNKYLSNIIEYRHHFHMYPELGRKEYNTAKIVADELRKLDIEVFENVSKTGVVGILKGKYPGKTVLLRADMDAIPIQENTDVPYKSTIDGVMHACGHDGHTATLLGVAMILSELRNELHGNVLKKIGADKVIFPERDMGLRVAHALISPNILDFIELSDDYSIVEIKATSQIIGQSLRQLDIRAKHNCNVMALKQNGKMNITPSPDDLILENDILIVVGCNDDLVKFEKFYAE